MQQNDKENLKKLGLKIKELRLAKSKSLNEFVLAKGFVTTATWSRVENGLFDLKFSTLLRIAYMLDVRVEDLLKEIDFDYSFTDE
ncbi:MAG: helix-turn-helix transcriptional regulator [Candidatus Gastranaerophilales bacterium]|nr:helix-turn-helix transcriptional regulator [Candidatus Gastranaerophilales bacterium]